MVLSPPVSPGYSEGVGKEKLSVELAAEYMAPLLAGRVRRQGRGHYEVLIEGIWIKNSGDLFKLFMAAARTLPPGSLRSALYANSYGVLRLLDARGFRDEEGVYQATSTW